MRSVRRASGLVQTAQWLPTDWVRFGNLADYSFP